MRTLEQTAVLRVFAVLRPRTSIVGDHNFQVLSPGHYPFRAVLTPYCSSLVSILALAAIAVFILRGPIFKRVSAFIVAGMFVLCCNVIRIGTALWAGLRFGPSGLVLFHDWLGTVFGLLYTLAGFLLMLYLMLPSPTANIARAARTSDVL
jgi:exosortase/archaeosortase family protein